MKFTLSWLKDHLDTSASLAEIVDALTRVGLEVESVEDPARKYDGFVVASVIEAKQHPNADRLRVCIVDAGGDPVQVVCGAPNARTGMKGVFSPVGTYIPGKKLTLAKGVIRGVESNGMLSSSSARITTASSNCPTTRRSALPTPASPGSTIPSSTSPSRQTVPTRPASPESRAISPRRD
jgi:tRNA-binding EMAP/Myf-like protein